VSDALHELVQLARAQRRALVQDRTTLAEKPHLVAMNVAYFSEQRQRVPAVRELVSMATAMMRQAPSNAARELFDEANALDVALALLLEVAP
jgi:hypothetical protein